MPTVFATSFSWWLPAFTPLFFPPALAGLVRLQSLRGSEIQLLAVACLKAASRLKPAEKKV